MPRYPFPFLSLVPRFKYGYSRAVLIRAVKQFFDTAFKFTDGVD